MGVPNYEATLFDTDNTTMETPIHWAVCKNNYKISSELIADYNKYKEVHVDDG